MPVIVHVLITAMYSVVATIAAAVLAASPLIANGYGLALGAALAALCGIFHLSVVHWHRYRVLSADVARLHTLSRELFAAVGEGGILSRDETAELQRVAQVVAEVKVLQNLIARLAGNESASAADAHELAPEPAPLAGELTEAEIIEILREALRLDRVDVYVQPVVRLPKREVCFYECFSRIRDASGAVILPQQFIKLAEREHLISAVDNIQLFRCVQIIRRTRRHDNEAAYFCNISRHSLADAEFFDRFIDFMAENRELASAIVFEFNHADVEELLVKRARDLERLAELGFRLSLDHVGGVDLDVKQLGTLGVRFIKIEAERLLAALKAGGSEIDKRDIKSMLRRRNIDLVVEKVENEEQLAELLSFKVAYGQGYLFGEPRPSGDT